MKTAQLVGIFSVASIFFSFHLWGIKVFSVGPGIQVAPWDIAGVLVVYIWMNHALRYGSPASRTLQVGIVLMLLFIMWLAFQALRSPDIFRSMTMLMLILRDFTLLIIVGALATYIRDFRSLNRAIFFMGIAIACISVLLFVLNLDIDGETRRPFGGTILLVDSHRVPRLIGFARDPNFFAMFMAVSLFAGLSMNRMRQVFKWAGLAIITASIALTLSRSIMIALPLALITVSVLRILSQRGLPRPIRQTSFRSWLTVIILIACVFFALTTLIQPFDNWLSSRLDRFMDSPRFAMWSVLMADPYVFITGAGLRGAQITLDASSHNSYLDILFDTGIIGFVLWSAFIFYVTKKGISAVRMDPDSTPWLQSLLCVLIMMATLSLAFHPIFWVVSAVVLARYSQLLKGRASQVSETEARSPSSTASIAT